MTAFRVVAFAEALSWLGLLTGMFFKYVVDAGEQGVHVFGPVHGTVFLTYLVVTLLTWRVPALVAAGRPGRSGRVGAAVLHGRLRGVGAPAPDGSTRRGCRADDGASDDAHCAPVA